MTTTDHTAEHNDDAHRKSQVVATFFDGRPVCLNGIHRSVLRLIADLLDGPADFHELQARRREAAYAGPVGFERYETAQLCHDLHDLLVDGLIVAEEDGRFAVPKHGSKYMTREES